MGRFRPRVALVWTFISLLVVASGAAWLLAWAPNPALPQAVILDIVPRSSRWAIANSLSDAGVLRSPLGLAVLAALNPSRKLKAGTYKFSGGRSTLQIFNQVANGETFTRAVVVPEGFDRFDIAHELDTLGVANGDQFLEVSASPRLVRDLDPAAVSLEGYLFPDTYLVSPHISAEQLAAMMVARFRVELKRQAPAPAAGNPYLRILHNWLTLASMVEKETSVEAERPLVAGVFLNRLVRGERLACDPTVIYAALLKGQYTGVIRRVDLESPSAYNTYVTQGLPPGPIANPGTSAWQAALHPARTPYMYFVSDGHGGHRFASTYAQHEKNVSLYRRTVKPADPHP